MTKTMMRTASDQFAKLANVGSNPPIVSKPVQLVRHSTPFVRETQQVRFLSLALMRVWLTGVGDWLITNRRSVQFRHPLLSVYGV